MLINKKNKFLIIVSVIIPLVCIFFAYCCIGNVSPLVSATEKYQAPVFLNDRASGVIGVRPVQLPGFAIPGGLTGAGQIVAVADSGLDIGVNNQNIHPDFRALPGQPAKIVALQSVEGKLLPSDPVGHGTHVAGSILGTGAASGGKYRGVAPGARLYFQSILNAKDQPDPPANINVLFDPAYRAGARIHVNSWGTAENRYIENTRQIDAYIRSKPDMMVIFGAGNAGGGTGGKGTLMAEANSKNALVVGASENPRPAFGNTSDRAGDIADFSSRGPASDGRIKPDLVAPGSAVISTKSSLVAGNFFENNRYTRMDGTSSAAAIAAGCTALLREFFASWEKQSDPSAALLKAALINGARKLGHDRMAEGFGQIDIQNTVLSLKDKGMFYRDEKDGIEKGKTREYVYTARSSEPLNITLCWTDPAPARDAATLVNDLNLVVKGPDGRTYYGNGSGDAVTPDHINNTEQVHIKNPQPGRYIIRVSGEGIKVDALAQRPGVNQDYALVFGQPMTRGVIVSVSANGIINLADGRSIIPSPGTNVHLSADNMLKDQAPAGRVPAGSDVYWMGGPGPVNDIYVSYTEVFAGLVRGLKTGGRDRISELLPEYSEGGFNLAASPLTGITVNGVKAGSIIEVLPGSGITGVMNPGSGELWQVAAYYRLVTGVVADVDPAARKLALAGDGYFQISRKADLDIKNNWLSLFPGDEPFAWLKTTKLENLPAGSSVALVQSPLSREVGSLYAENSLVSGMVRQKYRGGEIVLDTGQKFKLTRNTITLRNDKTSGYSSVKQGDWLMGVLDGKNGNELSAAQVYSRAVYGMAVECTPDHLTVRDKSGSLVKLAMDGSTKVYKGGDQGGAADIKKRDYVRAAADERGVALRVDTVPDKTAKILIKSINISGNGQALVVSGEGENYLLSAAVEILKDGLEVGLKDIVPGEQARITYFTSPLSGARTVTSLEVASKPESPVPSLKFGIKIDSGRDRIIISGRTVASVAYIYLDQSKVAEAPVKGGEFTASVEIGSAGKHELLAAVVDRASGGINRAARDIVWRPDVPVLAGSGGVWAEDAIRSMLETGTMSLTAGGAFPVRDPVSKGEFAAALARLSGEAASLRGDYAIPGAGDLPRNERDSIYTAVMLGIINNPAGGSTMQASVSRVEAVVMLWRLAEKLGVPKKTNAPVPGSCRDWDSIPVWGREAVTFVYQAGIAGGTPGGSFEPGRPLTRAEAAVLLNKLYGLLYS